jgi:hypothetical protein
VIHVPGTLVVKGGPGGAHRDVFVTTNVVVVVVMQMSGEECPVCTFLLTSSAENTVYSNLC